MVLNCIEFVLGIGSLRDTISSSRFVFILTTCRGGAWEGDVLSLFVVLSPRGPWVPPVPAHLTCNKGPG